jgi:hypothetical protein
MDVWASRFGALPLASGYPLHHLRAHASHFALGGSAAIPLANRTSGASGFARGYRQLRCLLYQVFWYQVQKYFILATRAAKRRYLLPKSY